MTEQEIAELVDSPGSMVRVLAGVNPEDKKKIYGRLGLNLTFDINAQST